MMTLFLCLPPAWAQDIPMPSVPTGGPIAAIGLLLLAGLAGVASARLARRRRELLSVGWLPDLLGVSGVLARAAAVTAILGAVIALLPEALLPSLPWVLVAFAVAIGWSGQAFLPDLLAGVVLRVSGRIRPGRWVQIGDDAGEVVAMGLFGAELQSSSGRMVLPNRLFLDHPVHTPNDQRPVAEVSATVPLPAADARRLLRELALSSPWVAPGAEPEISRADSAQHWIVRTPVLEPRHVPRFTGALLERLEGALSPERPAPPEA